MGLTPEPNMGKVRHDGLFFGPNVKNGGLMGSSVTQLKAQTNPSIKGKNVIDADWLRKNKIF